MLRSAKIISMIACLSFFIFPLRMYAADIPDYSFESRSMQGNTMPFSGELPDFTTLKNQDLAKEAQGIVDQFVDQVLAEVKGEKGSLPNTAFSYQIMGDNLYLSIILKADTAYRNTGSSMIKTIVFDKQKPQIISLKDLLGADAYSSATKTVLDTINKEPAAYYTGDEKFKEVSDQTDFYVDSASKIIVAFDKYEIAPGAAGSPMFEVGQTQEQSSVSGVIQDAAMHSIVIKTDDGRKLMFGTKGADKSQCDSLLIGENITIYYAGTINNEDTGNTTVIRLVQK